MSMIWYIVFAVPGKYPFAIESIAKICVAPRTAKKMKAM